MKSIHSILLASIAAASLATTLVACGSYSSKSGSGGTTAGTGGTTAGSGGTTAGTGGATTGTGGATVVTGGTTVVTGGTTVTTGGTTVVAGGTTVVAGGTTVVAGGTTAGTGGTTARTGGTTVTTGGTTVVAGGTTAGTGGTTVVAGGTTVVTGGTTARTGGTTAGMGGTTVATGGTTVATGGTTARTGGTTVVTGGTTAGTGGATVVTGGTTAVTGGTTAVTGGTTTGTGGSTAAGATLPCDLLTSGTNKCVSAHSTVRVIVTGYTGPLYQLCKGTANTGPSSCKGTPQDIGSTGGYADVTAHDAFCPTGTTCTITKIYDQSGMGNHLEPAPSGNICGPDRPANAGDLKTTINGHAAYGILIKPGIGYRTGCSGCTVKTGNGMATADQPQTMYMITSQQNLIDGCCFDYGNAETTSNDDGNGTMETIYFGAGVSWGTGNGGKPGPWVMADLENGLYAGWDSTKTSAQDKNIPTNMKLPYDFITAVVLGDTQDKNSGKGRFALYGNDATSGTLQTMYDGIRPAKTGYVPMKKQGSVILGIGGDNSCSAGGRFFEGAIATGPVVSKATLDALQAAIVAARYGK